MIKASICLSDIPKDKIVEAKNGKKYLNFDIAEYRNGEDKYVNTHSIYLYNKDTKEKTYIGNGKLWDFDRPPSQGDSHTGVNGLGEPKKVDDLPF